MGEQEIYNVYNAIGRYNETYWLVRAALTLGIVWLIIDLTRKTAWAQLGVKVTLALTCATAGILYYGVFVRSFGGTEGEWTSVWIPGIRGGVFVLAAILGMIDATVNSTRFVLPERGWRPVMFWLLLVLGVGYPAWEYVTGHVYPQAQAFGVFPAPNLIVCAAVLSTARTPGWVGRLWIVLILVLCLDTGLILALSDGQFQNIIVCVAGILSAIMLIVSGKSPQKPEPCPEEPVRCQP